MAVAHPAVFVAGVAVGMVVQLMLLRRRQSALGHAKGSPPEQPPSVAAGSQGSSHERLAHGEAPVTPGTARKLSRPPSLNTLMLRADTRKDLHASVQTLGILVHGCHLQAEGWEEIVWGIAPDKLGRVPLHIAGFTDDSDEAEKDLEELLSRLASIGAAIMVWSGLALSTRRLILTPWRRRRQDVRQGR